MTEIKHREKEFGTEDVIRYFNHFDNPEFDPPRDECEVSSYDDVKDCHAESHARLTLEPTLKPPSIGQDCDKTLEIYREFLYPVMRRQRIKHLVEDNTSPHNSDKIRTVHRQQRITIVGYEATEAEKREIVRLITEQTGAPRTVRHRSPSRRGSCADSLPGRQTVRTSILLRCYGHGS